MSGPEDQGQDTLERPEAPARPKQQGGVEREVAEIQPEKVAQKGKGTPFIQTVFRLLTTWWHGATIGTLVNTWWRGRFVGDDGQGNRYYEERVKSSGWAKKRRWVIFNGPVEASRVPPEWHAWLHHIVDEPPSEAPLKRQPWEKDHMPNMTGTPEAYRPDGSLTKPGTRPKATGDYEAWSPDDDEADGKA